MKRFAPALAVLLVALIAATWIAQARAAERRVALVVGNSDYLHAPRLDNPSRDARLIAGTLKDLGFTLIGGGAQENLDRAAFERAVRDFGRAIGPGTIALFYYSGHGMQMRGGNYLVPVSANLGSASDVDFELIDVDIVVRQMDAAHSSLNLLILDACRNNPFGGRGLRDGSAGLAEMRAPPATLISYATQPGGVAQDGPSGGDSPYSTALAQSLRSPGIDVFKAFNMVGVKVSRDTNGLQTPWVAASPIDGEFYLASAPAAAPPPPPVAPVARPDSTPDESAGKAFLPSDREALFWQSVQGTNRADELEAYLRRYPDGTFADLARTRLALLQPLHPLPASPAPPPPPPSPVQPAPIPPASVERAKPRDDPHPDAREATRPTPARPRPVSLPPANQPAPAPSPAPTAAVVGFAATALDGRGRRFFANNAGSEGAAVAEALRQCHGGGDASCRIVGMAHAGH